MTDAALTSPELALVCPELAARLRAAMPDRPWEMFVPRQSPLPAPAAPVPRGRSAAALSLVPVFLLVAFASLVVVGSLPGLGVRPSLAPLSPRAPGVVVITVPRRDVPRAGETVSRATLLARDPSPARP